MSVTTKERGKRSTKAAGSQAETNLPELSFVHPIPGFTDLRRFVLVRFDEGAAAKEEGKSEAEVQAVIETRKKVEEQERDKIAKALQAVDTAKNDLLDALNESPLYELRSVEKSEVRFLCAVPAAFFENYAIEIDDQEAGDLHLDDPSDALVLVMLTLGEDARSTTANLLAPIVINGKNREAAQVILTGSDWPVRAPLN